MKEDRLITVAIYTFEKAQIIKGILENEGIPVMIQNVNLIQPVISAGVRIRINESDLPHALQVLEKANLSETEEEPEELPSCVLVPIDFSSYSRNACRIGFDLAQRMDAKVIFLHAYFTPYFPGAIPYTDSLSFDFDDEGTIVQMQKMVQTQLSNFLKEVDTMIVSGLLPNIKYEYELRDGIPEDVIVEFAKECKPQVIVMGTRGVNQKELDLIGSVTAEVVDTTKYPVLAVADNSPIASFDQISNVAYFTNFEQRELLSIDRFLRFMSHSKFTLHFIHLEEERNSWDEIKLAGIKAYFGAQHPDVSISYFLIPENNFLESTQKYIIENHIDAIAISSRKRNIFARLFNPSLAHRMVFHTDTLLFVMPV